MSALESTHRRRRPQRARDLGHAVLPSAVDRSRQRLLEAFDDLLRAGATPTRAALSQSSGLPHGYISWAFDSLQLSAAGADGQGR